MRITRTVEALHCTFTSLYTLCYKTHDPQVHNAKVGSLIFIIYMKKKYSSAFILQTRVRMYDSDAIKDLTSGSAAAKRAKPFPLNSSD